MVCNNCKEKHTRVENTKCKCKNCECSNENYSRFKKIIVLTEEQYPYCLGGGTTYLRHLLKYNDKYRQLKIICPKWKKGSNYPKNVIALGLNYHYSKSFLLRTLFKLIYYPIWMASTLIYLRKEEYYIINAHEIIFSGMLAVLLSKMKKKPLLLTLHGDTLGSLEDTKGRLITYLFKPIFYFVKKRADKIVNYTNRLNEIQIPLAIEYNLYQHKHKFNQDIISYIGRISQEKNIELIIYALKKLEIKPTVWIIGDGKHKTRLEKLVKENGLSNKISFLGKRDDIPKLHREIGVLFYIWEKEPFGYSVLEAMASGIPCIVSNTPIFRELVGKTNSGIILNKVNEIELSKAIVRLRNKEFYEKCSKNAANTAKKYDVTEFIKKYDAVFEKMINPTF